MPRSTQNPTRSQAPSAAASRRAPRPPPASAPTTSLSQRLRPRTAFLVGLGPVPSPLPAERAAATLRRQLDGVQVENPGSYNEDMIIDEVLVHVPLGALVSDMLVRSTITHHAFLTNVCGLMGVSPNIAKLGWKSSDDGKAIMPRELQTSIQLEMALKSLIKVNSNPRRFKAISMIIIHLNPNAVPHERELLMLKEKLQCATHISPDGWCYVMPGRTNLDNHVPLGIAELNLWAIKIHGGSGDATSDIPPDCFRWAGRTVSQRPFIVTKRKSIMKNNNDSINGNEEDLLTTSLIRSLDIRFPKHNFPQYQGRLHVRGLMYARDILHFDHAYFLDLGIEEGAIGTFLEATKHALKNLSQQQTRKPSLKGKEPAQSQRHISVINLSDSESETESARYYDSDDISVDL